MRKSARSRLVMSDGEVVSSGEIGHITFILGLIRLIRLEVPWDTWR